MSNKTKKISKKTANFGKKLINLAFLSKLNPKEKS